MAGAGSWGYRWHGLGIETAIEMKSKSTLVLVASGACLGCFDRLLGSRLLTVWAIE
jgi:hypothetical protein